MVAQARQGEGLGAPALPRTTGPPVRGVALRSRYYPVPLPGIISLMSTETAAFRATDPDCLVAASLACPVCLSGEVDWRLSLTDDYESHADCLCTTCGHRRTVFLGQMQALRLAMHVHRPLDRTPRPDPEVVAL